MRAGQVLLFLSRLLGCLHIASAFLPASTTSIGRTSPLEATSTAQDRSCDVAVFGGGFGGLYTALAIAQEARANGRGLLDIALVEPSDQFVFLPLLYDLTIGTATDAEVCPYYKDILMGTGIRHVKASLDEFGGPDMDSAKLTEQGGASTLSFRASVVAVGATPKSSLDSVPGASQCSQPFYTQENAKETGELLARLESQINLGASPRIAIIGGGYAGVELAACVKRRLRESDVWLLSRGPPMKGTRAEPLVNKALARLGVHVEISAVKSMETVTKVDDITVPSDQVFIKRLSTGDDGQNICDDEPWDAVLWTAGSGPAYPVSQGIPGLAKGESGRLAINSSLQCLWENNDQGSTKFGKPPVWALGDCSEIIDRKGQPAAPHTAQAAMQQANIVACNVLSELRGSNSVKAFQYQDLGSMLTLGGPNAAVLAPRDGSPVAPLVTPLLDTARVGLGLADEFLTQLSKSPLADKLGLTPAFENLGLSLGGYGLGVDSDTAPGTLAGTLSGAARRAVYAARMPTNKQKAYAAASAAISTAVALAKEASDQMEKNANNVNNK